MNVAYVRVSSADQNKARQVENLQKFNIERWFTEKVSAKDTNRPELKSMLDFVRDGDTIYVHDFSRLARSVVDLLRIVEVCKKKNVRLVSVKENLDSHTPTGKLMLTMIGAINEFERANMLERQREGIAIAKREKKYKGRKRIIVDEDEFSYLYRLYMERKCSKAQIAKRLFVSRPTVDRLVREMQEKEKTAE